MQKCRSLSTRKSLRMLANFCASVYEVNPNVIVKTSKNVIQKQSEMKANLTLVGVWTDTVNPSVKL